MVIQRSSAAQTARLIGDITGTDPVKREAAAARLAIVGERAVERLLAALPDASPDATIAILRTLETIGSARVVTAALARLDSPSDAIAVAAVGALRPHLRSPDDRAAAQSLEGLTALALTAGRSDPPRLAALEALGDMGTDTLQPIRDRLQHDRSARVRRAAGLQSDAEAGADGSTHRAGAHQTSGHQASAHQASAAPASGHRGTGTPSASVTPTGGATRPSDRSGKTGRADKTGKADRLERSEPIERIERIERTKQTELTGSVGRAAAAAAHLEAAARGELPDEASTLRSWLTEAGGAVALSVLHDLVLALRANERTLADSLASGAVETPSAAESSDAGGSAAHAANPSDAEAAAARATGTRGSNAPAAEADAAGLLLEWMAVRAAAHQALAERHSRLAVFDLRDTFEHATTRLPIGFVAAIEQVGDASCLPAIAAAWQRVDDGWMRDHLASAFQAILKREGLTRRHAIVRRALERWPNAKVLLSKGA